MPRLTDTILHIRAMGRDVRITAVFTSDAEANVHMEANPQDGVIAETAGMVWIANVHDLGQRPRR